VGFTLTVEPRPEFADRQPLQAGSTIYAKENVGLKAGYLSASTSA